VAKDDEPRRDDPAAPEAGSEAQRPLTGRSPSIESIASALFRAARRRNAGYQRLNPEDLRRDTAVMTTRLLESITERNSASLEQYVSEVAAKRLRQGLHPLEVFGAWQAVRELLEGGTVDRAVARVPLDGVESTLISQLRGAPVRRPDAWPDGEVGLLRLQAERLAVGLALLKRGHPDVPDPHHSREPLTKRERDVISLAAAGLTTAEIAHAIKLSPATVRTYLSRAERKLGARNRAHAVALAVGMGVVLPPVA
jgi:LuxR family transcriptional regulator, transcriptional regulator of spore coat protein